METFEQFLERINSFEKPIFSLPNGDFEVNPSLKNKVDSDNNFKPFFGDTTVFDLTDITKEKIDSIVDELYLNAGECFCERLKGDTFHVTLHDLSNSNCLADIGGELFYNELNLLNLINENKISSSKITMKTNFIINMVNTSIVLALKPKTEEDYGKLMSVYNVVDKVKSLPYPLTPHITLAYFNPDGFSDESARKLEKVVNKLNETEFDIALFTDTLHYEKFTDMNTYHKIFPFTVSQIKAIPIYSMSSIK